MSIKYTNFAPKRVAIVSRDLEGWDLKGEMAKISELAERYRCDTVLAALWSEHRATGATWFPPPEHYFGASKKFPRFVIHETGNLQDGISDDEADLMMEVWARGALKPVRRFKIAFARSTAPYDVKKKYVDNYIQERLISKKTGIIYCGEFNCISTHRSSNRVRDEHGFLSTLEGTKALLVPMHRRPRRVEIYRKLKALSEGRTVITTHAQWREHGYAKNGPWAAWKNGKEITSKIREIEHNIRKDVRIGILSI